MSYIKEEYFQFNPVEITLGSRPGGSPREEFKANLLYKIPILLGSILSLVLQITTTTAILPIKIRRKIAVTPIPETSAKTRVGDWVFRELFTGWVIGVDKFVLESFEGEKFLLINTLLDSSANSCVLDLFGKLK
ncbi:hypothetical protein AFK68_20025 [Hydrocoleum sp. CS-953]|uniref:hypothetical protein n=1 Tax=Hydrocoleum sp. CS-953 TaxID=1671698 RepID=UPI000B9A4024|nr:hypothetical protein [Hydrocoleum sp. CS-953]OZH53085.1 hypothetical protein AFK68_20025 [Hydrocoleum sp. CS-953]